MKIETSTVTKMVISDLLNSKHRLDPVTVYAEDLGPSQGKIIIECYGKSWSAYWGGCGDKGVISFFCSCNTDYLVNCLERGIESTKYDPAQADEVLKKLVIKRRRVASNWRGWSRRRNEMDLESLTKDEAREMWDLIEDTHFSDDPAGNYDLYQKVYGMEEWWLCIPQSPNPDYQYLCRIVDAVREAFNMEAVPA